MSTTHETTDECEDDCCATMADIAEALGLTGDSSADVMIVAIGELIERATDGGGAYREHSIALNMIACVVVGDPAPTGPYPIGADPMATVRTVADIVDGLRCVAETLPGASVSHV